MPTFRHLALCALTLGPVATAHAQHGASDERVSLPEGPGSLEGVGDNALVSANMGSMSYAVPIDVPAGFPAVTPNLSLAYDSSGSSGVMGIGWDLAMPYVERMTNWGLPHYTVDDDFVAGGQLVHIGDGVYRNRFEKGFARHTWHDRGDGTQGYWTTEQPDGTVQYFGATAEGELVDSARVAGRGGATFRYQLVEQVDKFGHAMRLDYRTYDGLPHLDRISYIFTGSDGGPGASMTFEYADRPDVLTDARSGVTERRTQRLTAVNVFSKDVRIWRYTVHYEDEAISGGFSRVRRIDRVGLDDTPHPVAFDFEYAQTLGNSCDADCDQPYLVEMGSLGINLAAGDATLADMNGDALPDIIDTSREGAHRIFVNTFADRDQHAFELPYDSATGDRGGHQLSSPYVQALDANGDGRVDLVNVRTGEVLYNLGTGDWAEVGGLGDTAELPDFGDDFAGGAEEPTHVRFFDYDNDRRIDVLRSTLDQTTVYANMGQDGFAVIDDLDPIGAGFEGGLEMADMNGDGLQDAVVLRPGSLSYRANLGFGRWSAWTDIEDLPFNEAEREFVELQDINGDSLDDLVIVLGDQLRFALNRAGERFEEATSIDQAGGRALPTRVDGTTVLFADMNGSGSDDVVWISPQGDVTYLELFPVRPNLLTRLTNGLGLVTEIAYTTLVEERARAAEPWAYTLPFSMQVVASTDTYDIFNDQHRRQVYSYADAFYDTDEKAYRGFAEVITTALGDETQETGVTVKTYDVGAEDRYRNGLTLSAETYAVEDDGWAPLQAVTRAYDDCPVAEVPDAGLDYAIRHVCMTAEETVLQERAAPSEWIRTRDEYAYDGYGNTVASTALGVVDIAGDGCGPCDRPEGTFGAPCGATCEGDEMFVRSTYTRGQDRWILGLPVSTTAAAVVDSPEARRTDYFYDGDAFVGLPAGRATLGQLTRQSSWVEGDTWVDAVRLAYDEHGNVITEMGPLGAPGQATHSTDKTYDDEHLLLASLTVHLDDYALVTTQTYDAIWGQLEESDGPRVVIDGAPITPPRTTRYVYDALGDEQARFNPGDPADRPTVVFDRQFGAPVSRLVAHMRTARGAAQPDLTTVQCQDGFGRDVAQITASAPGRFEVSGFRRVNRNGETVEYRRPYTKSDDNCLVDGPDTAAKHVAYDARRRQVGERREDSALYGTDSQTGVTFEPLARHRYTPDDLDPEHPHFDTPMTQIYDGLGRQTALTLRETVDGEPLTWRYVFDGRGNPIHIIDPAGDVRTFARDGLGRTTSASDPDRGTSRQTFDAQGNVVRREDAAGRVLEQRFDSLGRMTARWDADDPEGTRVEYLYDLPSHCPDDLCTHGAQAQVGMTFPTPNGRGARWFGYSDRGRMTLRRTDMDGLSLVERFEYDNLNRLTAVIQPDGTTDTLTRDGIGRVVGLDGIAEFEWGPGSRLDGERLANGIEATYTHDIVEQRTSMRLSGADADLMDLRYTHDRTGQLIVVDDLRPPADGPGRGARFTYDGIGRLSAAELDPGRADYAETLNYTFDRRFNLTSKTSSLGAASRSHVGALTYDADRPHAAISAGDRVYDYDDAGLRALQDDQSFTWDARHQLVAVERGGAAVGEYWYADARIISRTRHSDRIHVSPTFEIEDGIASTYSLLGMRRVATRETAALAAAVLGDLAPLGADGPEPDGRFDTGDAVIAARAEGGELVLDARRASLRSMLRGAARSRLLDGETRLTFAHHDALRQLVLETGADGSIVARHAVDPHGLNRVGPADRGFEGRRLDAATDLVPMGVRMFDPWLARWATPDPEFTFGSRHDRTRLMEGSNPYGFVSDNPILHTDPSGRIAELANAIDDQIAIENLTLGNLVRGIADAATVVEFAFQNDYARIRQRFENHLAQYENNLDAEIRTASDDVTMFEGELAGQQALQGLTAAAKAQLVAGAGQRLAEARTRRTQAIQKRADFRNLKPTIAENLHQVDVTRKHRAYGKVTALGAVRENLAAFRKQAALQRAAKAVFQLGAQLPRLLQANAQPGAAPAAAPGGGGGGHHRRRSSSIKIIQ